MFRHKEEIEFVGGPFDGHRQTIHSSNTVWQEVIAVPVNENVFRMLAGVPRGPKAPASSVAIYELRRRDEMAYYEIATAKMPEEIETSHSQIWV